VAASKFPGVRAAVCHDCYTARQAVEHDDVNVLCIGARVIGPALARTLVETFLTAEFGAEERHLRRLAKIDAIETRFARE
jgi:ribose 5-phosphate isomerase B